MPAGEANTLKMQRVRLRCFIDARKRKNPPRLERGAGFKQKPRLAYRASDSLLR